METLNKAPVPVKDTPTKRRSSLSSRTRRRTRHTRPMNKTGARLLGMFIASFIAWVWQGWGEPATGVAMDTTMVASLGGACVVLTEWVLVPTNTTTSTTTTTK